MKVKGSAGSTAVVFALLLIVALTSWPLSSNLFTVPHDFGNDVSGRTNLFCLRNGDSARQPSGLSDHRRLSVSYGIYLENGSIPVASGGNRPVAALLTSHTGSTHAHCTILIFAVKQSTPEPAPVHVEKEHRGNKTIRLHPDELQGEGAARYPML